MENDNSISNLTLLELAANNDAERFKILIENDESSADVPGPWYCRKNSSNLVALDQRTPLMIAASYGSLEVLRLIIKTLKFDVNRSCGGSRTTALHCAASGGSANAVETVRALLAAGGDVAAVDADGNRPADVITVSPGLCGVKIVLEELLGKKSDRLRVCTSLSSASGDDGDSLSPSSGSTSSPMARKDGAEKKEYPIDPSFPDIKNSIYATDEFWMFSFKVRPCSRAYSHDWTECPFVHPGENARRRDPRKYHYSCVPCLEFRKGACRRGDLCEYAHGVFECWLHPAQYRTKLCKDGTACARPVCFFAHTAEELRPLYVSTGSAVPSPWSSASAMEMAAAMMSMVPGSPSKNLFAPQISPSKNGIGSLGRQQPSMPTLHLPGSNNLQWSRLRSSLSARDMPVDNSAMLSDFDELCFRTSEARFGRSKTFKTSNLDELFSTEISSSPRYNSDQAAVFSPSHKSAVFNQFQPQHQSSLSPINTNSVFSPLAADTHRISGHSQLLHASPAVSSPGRMSPRSIDARSPLSARVSQFSQQEKLQQMGTVSLQDLGSPVNSAWTRWGSPSGKPDWGVNGEEIGQFRKSAGIEWGSGVKEPDVSWVQPLVNPPEAKGKHGAVSGNDGTNSSDQAEEHAVLGAWLEHMQLDQLVA